MGRSPRPDRHWLLQPPPGPAQQNRDVKSSSLCNQTSRTIFSKLALRISTGNVFPAKRVWESDRTWPPHLRYLRGGSLQSRPGSQDQFTEPVNTQEACPTVRLTIHSRSSRAGLLAPPRSPVSQLRTSVFQTRKLLLCFRLRGRSQCCKVSPTHINNFSTD